MNIFSQNDIEKFFENSSIPIYWKEKNGQYLNVNQAFLLDSNKDSISDIIGRKDIDLWNGCAPYVQHVSSIPLQLL